MTIHIAVNVKSDGTKTTQKTLMMYEKTSTREKFNWDLLDLQRSVPEAISYEEIGRLLAKRQKSPMSITNENAKARPSKLVIRIAIELDPSMNALDLVSQSMGKVDRRRRGNRRKIVETIRAFVRFVVEVVEIWYGDGSASGVGIEI